MHNTAPTPTGSTPTGFSASASIAPGGPSTSTVAKSSSIQDPLGEPQLLDIELTTLVRRCVFALAMVTLGLMALGSATRVMNAGLSCPDWPLCYGTLVPTEQMNLQVFLEWFHRLVASTVGFCVIALVSFTVWKRAVLPDWLPWAAGAALSLVIFQGVLGGLTVTELLRFDIVTAHLGTGLLFFCTLLAISIALLPLPTKSTNSAEKLNPVARHLPLLGAIAVCAIYGQSLLGALVASQWALHLCFGESELCSVMNAHLLGIVPATVASLAVVGATAITKARSPLLILLSRIVGGLLLVQLSVGYATFRLHLQVEPLTVTHQAIGAALLGTLLCYTLIAWRQFSVSRPQSSEPNSPVSVPQPSVSTEV